MPRLSIHAKQVLLKVLYVVVIVGVIAIVIMVGVLLKSNSDSKAQRQKNQDAAIARNQGVLDEINATGDRLENDMACLGAFYSLTNRAALRIVDLQKCVIIDSSTGEQRTLDTSQFVQASVPASNSPTGTSAQAAQPKQPATSTPTNTPPTQNTPADTRSNAQKLIDGTVDGAQGTVDNVLQFLTTNPFRR